MSRRIAIVEDEAAIRENYADVLRKQGYEVQTYANRKDAMAAFDIRDFTQVVDAPVRQGPCVRPASRAIKMVPSQ